MSISNKLALGTVQFGLDYGISNQLGKTERIEVKKILQLALDSGIDLLDTASLYGNSEEVIGSSGRADKFFIVTKTPHFSGDKITNTDIQQLEESFFYSIDNLKTKPYGLLVHNADDLLKPKGFMLYEKLKDLKNKGHVIKIGVSVYDPEQCNKILDVYDIDLVQLPMNIYDQRFLKCGSLDLLKKKGIEIHVRSVFLQGILLLKKLPRGFEEVQDTHDKFLILCNKMGQSQLSVALSFIAAFSQVDKLIIGVNNAKQLKQILRNDCCGIDLSKFEELCIDQGHIINPSKW